MVKNSDVQKLKDEISRLMAALEDVNFECQRLEIINSNLDFQLKSVNRELKQNIAMLEALEEENKTLKEKLFPIFSMKKALCFSEHTTLGSITVFSAITSILIADFLFTEPCNIFPVLRKYSILSASSTLLPETGRLFFLQKSINSFFK